jgi:hypothetical protein
MSGSVGGCFYEHVGFTRLIAGSLRLRLLVKDLEGRPASSSVRGDADTLRHRRDQAYPIAWQRFARRRGESSSMRDEWRAPPVPVLSGG